MSAVTVTRLNGHSERGGYDSGTKPDIPKPGFGTSPEFDAAFAYHFGLDKPVIAAMNGPAAGVGLALACFADLRFAVPGVKFTTAHGKLNLPCRIRFVMDVTKNYGLRPSQRLALNQQSIYVR